MLVKTLIEIRNNRLDTALAEVEKVMQSNPNFRLAQLIKGDLLLARSRPLRELGDAPNAPRDRVEDLRDEARVRLARYHASARPTACRSICCSWIPSRSTRWSSTRGSRRSTCSKTDNGEPHYVADYYISSGKNGVDKSREGDKKTPLGVYHVTANLPRAKLADFYGSGAFPISYPNEWDRREGRNGHGIWLHGTPSDTYSRPPRASDGCVVLTNEDLDVIGKNLQIGLTPVIISEGIEWVKPEALDGDAQGTARRASRAGAATGKACDTERYLKHYAPGFSSGTPGSRCVVAAEAPGQRRQDLDQARARPRQRVPLPGPGRTGGRHLRPGLPQQQSVQSDEEAPVLDAEDGALAHPLRRRGLSTGSASSQLQQLFSFSLNFGYKP